MFALQGILAECMQAVWEIKADYMIIDPAHTDTHPSRKVGTSGHSETQYPLYT